MEGGQLSVEQERVPTEQIVSAAVEAQKPLAASVVPRVFGSISDRASPMSGPIATESSRCSRT